MPHKDHFENLDGLRFLAFMTVFVSHIFVFLGFSSPVVDGIKNALFIHGDLGVTFFFVLSGFLITHLLMREKAGGDISLKHFYVRRGLRIWPLYLIVLVIGYYVVPALGTVDFPFLVLNNSTSIAWFVFFVANIKLALSYAPPAILGVLWSVSVEEQFYLVWPFLVKFLRRKDFIIILVAIIAYSCWYRFTNYDNYGAVHHFTMSVFSGLAIGALSHSLVEPIKAWSRDRIAWIYLLTAALVPARSLIEHVGNVTIHAGLVAIEPVVFGTLFAVIILEQCYSERSFWKAGRHAFMTRMGKISYGLYMYHMIAFFVVVCTFHAFGAPYHHSNILLFIMESAAALVVTIGLSELSYSHIEVPFLKFKEKFGYKKKEPAKTDSFSI